MRDLRKLAGQGLELGARAILAAALLTVIFGTGAVDGQVINAYVASTGNTRVLVINTATNTTKAVVSGTGSRVITLSADEKFAYSTNFNGISKIDRVSNAIVATLATGNNPVGIALTSDGATAYVANNASATVSVVDTATMTVTATLSIAPQAIATTPDGSAIWVTANIPAPPFPGVIDVIDPATNTFTTFPLGHGVDSPTSIAFTPDGAFAYLTYAFTGIVSVVDTATHTEVATITAGNLPSFAAVTPDGAFVYVANLLSNDVSIIDTATNTVVATVPVGAFPRGIAFTPDGAAAYVTNFNSNSISVIDTAGQAVISTFSAGSRPWGIVIGPAPNPPPVLTSDQASVTVNEGQTAANTGTVSDAAHNTVTLTASVGTVVNNGDGTWSWSFLASEPIPSQTVTITGNDGHGGTGSTSFTLMVNDVPPSILSVTNNGPITVGGSATITVNAADATGGNDPLSYEFDCNNDGIFEIGPQAGNTAACSFATAGLHTVNVRVTDGEGGVTLGSTTVTVNLDCSHATASPNLIWPPNHKLVPIQLSGVANPGGGAVAFTVTGIFQDEPVHSGGSGNTGPDGTGVGTSTPSVRAERDGGGDGRVYHIFFTAANGAGASCAGAVTVGVPKSQGHNGGPVDEGPLYDSTQP
jgi:YVTN family beta-propeller protein